MVWLFFTYVLWICNGNVVSNNNSGWWWCINYHTKFDRSEILSGQTFTEVQNLQGGFTRSQKFATFPQNVLLRVAYLCTPYNHAPCHFTQSHIRKVYACLAVTCHLQFWQNDRDLSRATAVTRGGTDTEIGVSTESRPWRRKFSRRSSRYSNPRPFSLESGALTTELSPPRDDVHIICETDY